MSAASQIPVSDGVELRNLEKVINLVQLPHESLTFTEWMVMGTNSAS
jgi:hypothetical protein